MPTKLLNAVKSAVLADLQVTNRVCENLDNLVYDFIYEIYANSSKVNTVARHATDRND
jgi:hypothetical protein